MMEHPTEGVPNERLQKSFLQRNLRLDKSEIGTLEDPEYSAVRSEENLQGMIDVETYHLTFAPGGYEFWIMPEARRFGGKDGLAIAERVRQKRNTKFKEMFVERSPWMKGLEQDAIEAKTEEYRKIVAGEEVLGEKTQTQDTGEDVEMTEA